MSVPLRTTTPTGQSPWPFVLVEGAAHAGATWQALSLSASERVGRVLVFAVGERDVDRYAELGEFEVVELNGTFTDLVDQLTAALGVGAEADGRPPVLVFDGESGFWAQLLAWGSAKTRTGAAVRKQLAEDPGSAVRIPHNVWDDIHARHDIVMDLLRRFCGPVVVTARGGPAPSTDPAGNPVPTAARYEVQGDRRLTSDADVWVRVHRGPLRVELISARNPADDLTWLDLPLAGALDYLVFDVLEPDSGFVARDTTPLVPNVVDAEEVQRQLLAAIAEDAGGISGSDARAEANRLWRLAGMAHHRQLTDTDRDRLLALVGTAPDGPTDDGETVVVPCGDEPEVPGCELSASVVADDPPGPGTDVTRSTGDSVLPAGSETGTPPPGPGPAPTTSGEAA